MHPRSLHFWILVIVCSTITVLGILAKNHFVGAIGVIVAVTVSLLTLFQKDLSNLFAARVRNARAEEIAKNSYELILSRFVRAGARFDVTCLSALNYDSIFRVESIEPDREYLAIDHAEFSGGSGANTGHILARQGAAVSILGIVGNDDVGNEMLRELREAKIDVSLIYQGNFRSGRTAVISDIRGRRLIAVDPGANLHIASIVEREVLAINSRVLETRVFHVSSFAQHSSLVAPMRLIINNMPDNIALSYVPGDIQSKYGLDDSYNGMMFSRADCIFIYEKQLDTLLLATSGIVVTVSGSLRDRVTALLDWRTKNRSSRPFLLCIKREVSLQDNPYSTDYLSIFLCGSEVIKISESRHINSVDPTNVYDSTGAGDAAAAGVISGLLDGCSLDELTRRAFSTSISVASTLGPRGRSELASGQPASSH